MAVPVIGGRAGDERLGDDVAAGEVRMVLVKSGVQDGDPDVSTALARRGHTGGLKAPGRLVGVLQAPQDACGHGSSLPAAVIVEGGSACWVEELKNQLRLDGENAALLFPNRGLQLLGTVRLHHDRRGADLGKHDRIGALGLPHVYGV